MNKDIYKGIVHVDEKHKKIEIMEFENHIVSKKYDVKYEGNLSDNKISDLLEKRGA